WLIIEGEWKNNKKFGKQLDVRKWKTISPKSKAGIKKYLSSSFIKGVGPSTAQNIVDKFGDKSLEIIDKLPEKLIQVPGIGKKTARKINHSYRKHKYLSEIMVFLQSYNIGPATCMKIYKRYGKETIEKLEQDPYRMTEEIWGIGFKKADQIAKEMGIEANSPRRIRAALLFAMRQAKNNGHVYLPLTQLMEYTNSILGFSDKLEAVLQSMVKEESLLVEEDRIYLPKLLRSEKKLAENLIKFRESSFEPISTKKIKQYLDDFDEFQLDLVQIQAVQTALQEKLTVITGGPGTGKTTIIRVLCKVFAKMNKNVVLAAPTGKAAKRLSQATRMDAKTIHRLLQYNPHERTFMKSDSNPLDADLVVIDEVSMVDLLLMHALVKAVPYQARMVLVGDVNQLPSVGPGSVLEDIISSKALKVVKLTRIFRQARESVIVKFAHAVNKGKVIEDGKGGNGDLFFIERSESGKIVELIKKLVTENIPNTYKLDNINDIQILSPMKKGDLGTENLNNALQEALNPHGEVLIYYRKKWKKGDRIIQLKNNYELEVFNGDTGFISNFDLEEEKFTVNFDGRLVERDFSDLSEMDLAYAVTIHKSQGNEYPAVIIPVHTKHAIMLQRNLLYTGITRAKSLVVLVGTRRALGIAVSNNFKVKRYNWLKPRLARYN
nr:ATP-dependent RecD-like DNA helicase [Deltaproteobacteria bacterium]